MKTYMPLNGLRWSRNSGSARCDMPQSAVFGRPGGGDKTKEYLNTSQELPDTLLSADRLYVSDISFRNKEKGWKEYRMTIKLKEQE